MNEIIKFDFHGQTVTVIEYKGRPAFLCSEVATAIGYSSPKRLASNISGRWANEFVEGVHYHRLDAAEVAALREVVTGSVTTYTVNLILLTEEGVWLATVKAKTPEGRKLRSVVSEDIRKTGTYALPGVQPQAPALSRDEIVQIATVAAVATVQAMGSTPTPSLTSTTPTSPTTAPDGWVCRAEIARDFGLESKQVQKGISAARRRLLTIGQRHASRYQAGRTAWFYSPAEVEQIRHHLLLLGIQPTRSPFGLVGDMFGDDN